jgi:hypothetical protein
MCKVSHIHTAVVGGAPALQVICWFQVTYELSGGNDAAATANSSPRSSMQQQLAFCVCFFKLPLQQRQIAVSNSYCCCCAAAGCTTVSCSAPDTLSC